jgi:thiosulfate/3-mercaptopyruvate sulfurtransferase
MLAALLGRAKLPLLLAIIAAAVLGEDGQSGPWSKSELIEPASLAQLIKSSAAQPNIISVVFPVMYRQRHIPRARLAGPASRPEGLEALRKAVSTLPKDAPIVIYCGCCPMERCPNLRPAYAALKELGFTQIRILDLPTNFHTDWVEKGYPVE